MSEEKCCENPEDCKKECPDNACEKVEAKTEEVAEAVEATEEVVEKTEEEVAKEALAKNAITVPEAISGLNFSANSTKIALLSLMLILRDKEVIDGETVNRIFSNSQITLGQFQQVAKDNEGFDLFSLYGIQRQAEEAKEEAKEETSEAAQESA